MPHDLDLILTLCGGLTAALAFGFAAHRVGLSPIVGYLLAGIAVGPFTPGFVANRAIAEQLAEIGVILLLFGVGLEFHLKELLSVRKVAVPGAIAQSAVATLLGMGVGMLFDWRWEEGLLFGLAISVASTVVLTRVLADNRALHTPSGHIAVGWLVVEDIFTVLVLVLMPALFGDRGEDRSIPTAIAMALLKLSALVAFTFVIGQRVIPAILGYVAKTRSRELFTLTVLVLALGIAVGSAKLFGASMALGAFLAGMVVGQSQFSARAASEALPLRDAFAVLFFVSVGMLFDPRNLTNGAWVLAATLAIVLVGKPLAALVVVLLLRYPVKTAISVAVALAQIGEFSFILAALGREFGVVREEASQALVGASIVSIVLNPILYRTIEPISRRLAGRLGAPGAEPRVSLPPEERAPSTHRVVLVGHGPIGRVLTRLLRSNGLEPTVIELNHETVARLNRDGIRAIYGDASEQDILRRAGVPDAASVIFTADGADPRAVKQVREMNANATLLVRARYASESVPLERAGATQVVSGETEVALAMIEHVLTSLGATREQLDNERDRVRRELHEKPKPARAADKPAVTA